jgi:iron-sulfur cluster assembly protein
LIGCREDSGGEELLLRVGVKAGGCSGMSYTMDFENDAKIGQDDTVIEYDGFKLVSDAMSLLYLFGETSFLAFQYSFAAALML